MSGLFMNGRNFRLGGRLLFLLLSFPALFLSCNQGPIFFAISKEEAPKDPRISGSPTNIIALEDGSVYVTNKGNGRVRIYKDDVWDFVPSDPGGAVRDLAGAKDKLYALTEGGLRRLNDDKAAWTPISLDDADYTPVSAYGAGDNLFVGAYKRDNTYGIFYIKNNTGSPRLLQADTGLLRGAALYDNSYYIAAEKGLFVLDGSDRFTTDNPQNFTGVLAFDKGVVAVRRVGTNDYRLLFKDASTDFKESNEKKLTFTGALGVWKDADGKEALLLLGVQDNTTTAAHGYRELLFNADGTIKVEGDLRTPGNNPVTTVEDRFKYDNSMGKYPVLSILQISPGQGGVIFASTPRNGLYSYRGGAWNAEE